MFVSLDCNGFSMINVGGVTALADGRRHGRVPSGER
jgi:hypothetical protein